MSPREPVNSFSVRDDMKLTLLILNEEGHELNNMDICNLDEQDCFDVANSHDLADMVKTICSTFSNPVVPSRPIKWVSI